MVRLSDVPEPEYSVIKHLECPRFESTPHTVPVAASKRIVTLISTAGLMIRGQRPFLSRDPGYREIPSTIDDRDILCSHVSVNFDRSGFQQDLNTMLPRDRLRELAENNKISCSADTHYSFMGATNPESMELNARALGRSLLALGVNTVVLAPV